MYDIKNPIVGTAPAIFVVDYDYRWRETHNRFMALFKSEREAMDAVKTLTKENKVEGRTFFVKDIPVYGGMI
jgi:hypothetical protein